MLLKLLRMASPEFVAKLKSRADLADSMITQLRQQLTQLREAKAAAVCADAEKEMKIENDKLRKEVENLKKELCLAEIHNGVKQVFKPANRNVVNMANGVASAPAESIPNNKTEVQAETLNEKQNIKAEQTNTPAVKEGKAKAKKNTSKQPPAAAEVKIDVSRLDMRVGHIVSAQKHPNADRLYIEDVNLGEEKHRTIVSGLAGKIPLEQMQDRMAVFMLNLKPAKMQGVMSEGMIMCASEGDTVEILVPPKGAEIGDRVSCPDYEGTPDAQLNPKKKVWEQIKPDMKTNADKAATYKGSVLSVAGKGPLLAPNLANGQIS